MNEKNSIKVYKVGIFLCIISLYFLPYRLRVSYNHYLAQFNILFYFGLFVFFSTTRNKNDNENNSRFLFNVILMFFLGILILVSHRYSTIYEKLGYFVATCCPIIIVNKILKFDNNYLDDFIKILYKSLKFVCFALVISWIFDVFFDSIIQRTVVSFYNSSNLSYNLKINRFVSIFGHPLDNAILMFSLLLWTLTLNYNGIKVYNYFLTIIVSVIGIAITGSKSILVLAFLLILVYCVSKKNYKYIVPVLLFTAIFYKTGLFDLTLSRFSKSLASGDVSSGRNTNLFRLIQNGTLQFNLFTGYLIDKNIEGIIAAFEYPIIRWAYNSGIVFTLTICYYYFLKPLILIIKNCSFRFLLVIVIYIFAVNIQDALASQADSLIVFTTNISLLYYVVKNNKKILGDRNEENKIDDVNTKS